MLCRLNSHNIWVDYHAEEQDSTSDRPHHNNITNTAAGCGGVMLGGKQEMGSLSTFKSMFEVDHEWYVTNAYSAIPRGDQDSIKDLTFSPRLVHPYNLLLLPGHSSSSCSPSSSVVNNLDASLLHSFMPPTPTLSSLLHVVSSNPSKDGFDLSEIGFLENQGTNSTTTANVSSPLNRPRGVLGNFGNFTDLSSTVRFSFLFGFSSPDYKYPHASPAELPPALSCFTRLDEISVNPLFSSRTKLLSPLETYPIHGRSATLFQREQLEERTWGSERDKGKRDMTQIREENDKQRNSSSGDDFLEELAQMGRVRIMHLGIKEYTLVEETGKNVGNSSKVNSGVTGRGEDQKGKKRGLPAKNLMAQWRRRMQLNDRLYTMRSVVPQISKMDRPSILGDAIEYLKELLQRINDLHNELESTPPSSSLTPTTSFHPLTPTPSAEPSRIMDQLCPSSLPSPNGQPARVEVRVREARAVNIHMFCGRKTGLLLFTMRALDNLGLDIQQAVISCFNGFPMDILRNEQRKEGQDMHPDQIKAVLLDSAGFHGTM
uniref:Inducer of CBF expression 1 protein n=1 Tax=Populus suaveolens TaxID=245546 RepID=Q1HIU3_9ROSI|nr:inducer of CBF expression 1 protein [Populus suaveolens]